MKKILAMLLALSTFGHVSHAAVPGMRGVDHIGITVPDLSEAIAFFQNILGCEPFYQLGPFMDPEGDWMKNALNVHPRTEITKMQLMRCANGSNLELFQYKAPDQQQQGPKNSDIGGHHIAFYVDDIDAAVAYLKANGVRVLGAANPTQQGPSAGETWVYFQAPWGLYMEFVSYPNGKAYEKGLGRKLFSPRDFPN
jgi:catechol 2,3-dioxygenase-like lactoylglutathione lyase family enzyme